MTTKPKATVFTSTYNRAHTLPALYKSLQRQSCKDFEWIIIDDGSNDETEALVEKWRKNEKSFPIIYKKVQNGGKHRAINIGVSLSNAPFFFIADSDDYLTDNAIEATLTMAKSIKNVPNLAGIAGTKIFKDGKTIGEDGHLDDGSFVDATNLERGKYHLAGDKQEVYRTSILKKFPFPEIKGETFLSERIVWDKIAREGYKIRWFNTPLLICEYRSDGLSQNLDSKNKSNPVGFALYIKNQNSSTKNPLQKFKNYYSYFVLLKEEKSASFIKKNLKINSLTLSLLKILYSIKH